MRGAVKAFPHLRATETSPSRQRAGVKRGNLYAEQSRIGNEGLPAPLKVSGWLLDLPRQLGRLEKWPHKERYLFIDRTRLILPISFS